MLLNYFGGQTPPAHNTSMTLYTSELLPFSTIPPMSAIPGTASFVPPLASAGGGSNTTAGIRYAAPHDRLNETTTRIWEVSKLGLRRDMGLSPISHRIYQKLYPSIFDSVAYHAGWRIPDFSKFDGEGSRTTWEHVSQYLAQLGEASSVEALRVQLFSLSLTGTVFAWFSSLPAHSIYGWEPLERKFHEHFYCGTREAKLADLTSVRQTRDESTSDYFKRFKEIKNQCFNLTISKKDLADLAFQEICSYLREKMVDASMTMVTIRQALILAMTLHMKNLIFVQKVIMMTPVTCPHRI
jgi:hypothetical protein